MPLFLTTVCSAGTTNCNFELGAPTSVCCLSLFVPSKIHGELLGEVCRSNRGKLIFCFYCVTAACAVFKHRWQHPQQQRWWAGGVKPIEVSILRGWFSSQSGQGTLPVNVPNSPAWNNASDFTEEENSFHWGNEYCISCSVTKTAEWWIFVLLQMQMVLSGNHF